MSVPLTFRLRCMKMMPNANGRRNRLIVPESLGEMLDDDISVFTSRRQVSLEFESHDVLLKIFSGGCESKHLAVVGLHNERGNAVLSLEG